jgi:hypothetical protein
MEPCRQQGDVRRRDVIFSEGVPRREEECMKTIRFATTMALMPQRVAYTWPTERIQMFLCISQTALQAVPSI